MRIEFEPKSTLPIKKSFARQVVEQTFWWTCISAISVAFLYYMSQGPDLWTWLTLQEFPVLQMNRLAALALVYTFGIGWNVSSAWRATK